MKKHQNMNNYMRHPPPRVACLSRPCSPRTTTDTPDAAGPCSRHALHQPPPRHLKPLPTRPRTRVSLQGPPGSEWSPCSVQGEVRTEKARQRALRKTCLPMGTGSRGCPPEVLGTASARRTGSWWKVHFGFRHAEC